MKKRLEAVVIQLEKNKDPETYERKTHKKRMANDAVSMMIYLEVFSFLFITVNILSVPQGAQESVLTL